MDTVMNYKCPGCGSPLEFDSKTQKMVCRSCENSYTAEQLRDYDEVLNTAVDSEPDWSVCNTADNGSIENIAVYVCPSCGAEISVEATSAATECPYCNNRLILSQNIAGALKPDVIIPFKLDKKAAKEALSNHLKGKVLLPKLFRQENRIEKITGMYVPFWLFDCDTSGTFTFDCTRVNTWRDSKYSYTCTKHFLAHRSGKVGFNMIPVDGSKKMEDDYMDAVEPFDYSQLVPFQSAYLSGYAADKYDVDSTEASSRANERVRESTRELFASTVKGYASVMPRSSSVNLQSGDIKYAMFPIWVLNTKYKDKMYKFAMNGQTGRLIGDLPCDWGKFWGIFAAVAASLCALGQIAVFTLLR